MTHMVADRVLDYGLADFHARADQVYLCTQDPADFTGATSTYAAGNKRFGVGLAVGAPGAAASPIGRKVTAAPVTDGSTTATVAATDWAIVDSANSRLLCNGGLSSSQLVTAGNSFEMVGFDIILNSRV